MKKILVFMLCAMFVGNVLASTEENEKAERWFNHGLFYGWQLKNHEKFSFIGKSDANRLEIAVEYKDDSSGSHYYICRFNHQNQVCSYYAHNKYGEVSGTPFDDDRAQCRVIANLYREMNDKAQKDIETLKAEFEQKKSELKK